MQELAVKKLMIELCRHLHQKNYLAAADGNLSYRFSDNRIIVTPSGKNKCFIREEELALVDIQGRAIFGIPSSELAMHLEVYRRQPLARAVVHAHPPCVIAWSIARPELLELPTSSMSEVILGIGAIPIIPYSRPGTSAMGENLVPFLSDHRAFILARHGALSWGEDLVEALNGIERLEHAALVLKYAEEINESTSLPDEEITILKEMRKKKGSRSL